MEIALVFLKKFWPYIVAAVIAFGAGWTGAWKLQGLRLAHAQKETAEATAQFEQYKATQQAAYDEAQRVAESQRKENRDAYETERKKLQTQIAAGDAFRRCVAAGFCGGLSVKPGGCPGLSVQTTGRTDGAGTDTVSPSPGSAEEGSEAPKVVDQCALVTLQLNKLQETIERQPGY